MTNPFSTRFTRPGAIEFLFAEGHSLDSLVARLRENRWRGQIIGPHGSGKSTLVAALVPALEASARRVIRVQGERSVAPPAGLDPAAVLMVDGYEQLSWWSRWRVTWACRRSGAGLLATAHADVGLPTIFQTQPTLELARQIARRLLPPGDSIITESDIAAAWERHPGNLREVLFELFDHYQARAAIGRG